MQEPTFPFLSQATMPIALYNSQQVYSMEQAWFAQGHDSFALMQQAAWQMAQHIKQLYHQQQSCTSKSSHFNKGDICRHDKQTPKACVWVGQGNNGGDGWLIAHYLQQAGWRVKVITVGSDSKDDAKNSKDSNNKALNNKALNNKALNNKALNNKALNNKANSASDAIKAQNMAIAADCYYQRFEDSEYCQNNQSEHNQNANSQNQHKSSAQELLDNFSVADIYVDALFGIGLDRAPAGIYQQAIIAFNQMAQQTEALVVAVDIPSGLVASTGQVFDHVAIQADVTLCLVARKFGLHTKDGMDYAGEVLDIPLLPYESIKPAATLLTSARCLSARRQNSYKGSYGHVLIIGGNRIDGSQGMGGAAILSASSAMATGAGKITVACHQAFHGALLSSLPDAMTIDLHDQEGVKGLIEDASVIAIGMGLGRDDTAKQLFISYVQAAMTHGKSMMIDADGLYHLAALQADNHPLVKELRAYSIDHTLCLTPHSGEAAKLLNKEVANVEADRLAAIKQCADVYGGDWVLKGAGSLVLERVLEKEQVLKQEQVYVCGVGNAGMATAGMGDVLSGITAGLLAQQDLERDQRSLRQAVLIHGLAGDALVNQRSVNQQCCESIKNSQLLIGQRGLQAQDMPAAVRHVMQLITA